MKYNMGRVDRGLRIFVGIILIGLAFTGPQTPLGWIGLIPLVTGLFGTCGLYIPFGIDTRNLQDPETTPTP